MSTIADLIIAQGANAARAREAQGQVWGRAVENISQIPAQVMEQRRYQQHLDMQQQALQSRMVSEGQQQELGRMQIAKGQQQIRAEQLVGSVPQDEHGNLDENKLVDLARAQEPGLVPHVRALVQTANSATNAYAEQRLKADEMRDNALGEIGLKLLQRPDDLGSFHTAIAQTLKRGLLDSATANQMLASSVEQPGFIQQQAQTWVRGSKEARAAVEPKVTMVPKGATPLLEMRSGATPTFGNVPGFTPQAEPPTGPELDARAQALYAKREAGTITPQETHELSGFEGWKAAETNPVVHAEAARHNLEMERIQGLQVGRERAANAETARHNREMEKAANPFGNITMPTTGPPAGPGQGPAAAPAPGGAPSPQGAAPNVTAPTTAGPTGADYLRQLPPPVASEVKAYAEGRRPFPTGMSMYRLQPLIQMVGQYDPTFDAGNYNARNKARSDLTSLNGAGAKQINNLNTAIAHLGTLSEAATALQNGDIQRYNQLANFLKTEVGWTGKTDFDTVAPKLADEIERLWRGSGGSEGSIERTLGSLNSNMGPNQLKSAIAKSGDLIEGKLSTLEQQRDTVMGPAGKDIPIIHPKSRTTLEKLRNAATPRAGGAGVDTPPGTGAGTTPRFSVGQVVAVRGKQIKITVLHPDGTFDGTEVGK